MLGFDVDRAKVKQLNDGASYIQHVPDECVAALVGGRRFEATVEIEGLKLMDTELIGIR